MLSVKHLPVQRVASQQILRAAFSRRFLVAQVPQPRSSGGAGPEQVVVEQWYYLILLPPQHHLLLRCTVRETSSDVHVATDAWRCLPFLESELQAQLEAVDSSSSSS